MSKHLQHVLERHPNDRNVAAHDYLLKALAEEESSLGVATDELRVVEANLKAQQMKVTTLREARSVLEGSDAA